MAVRLQRGRCRRYDLTPIELPQSAVPTDRHRRLQAQSVWPSRARTGDGDQVSPDLVSRCGINSLYTAARPTISSAPLHRVA